MLGLLLLGGASSCTGEGLVPFGADEVAGRRLGIVESAAASAVSSYLGSSASSYTVVVARRVHYAELNDYVDFALLRDASQGTVRKLALWGSSGKPTTIVEVEQALLAARRARYGKLDARLHAIVQTAAATDVVPVTVWYPFTARSTPSPIQ